VIYTIGVDPAIPDGTIVFATRDAQGRISQVRAVGGYIRGPGDPGDDSIQFRPMAGEQLIPAEELRRDEDRQAIADEFARVIMPAVIRREQARQELADRLAAAPAPAGDVLDRIDAAVDELCACGCRKQVPADGASAYFASPDCQQRWHSAQTTDPQDVYRRDDAASVYVGADGAHVPLHAAPVVGETRTRVTRRADPIPSCPDLYGAGWRRQCPPCGEAVIPQYVRDDDFDIMTFGSAEPIRFVQPETRMVCPRCCSLLPGPLFYAYVREDGGHLVLGLSDGQSRTTRRLRLASLIANRYPAGEVGWNWAAMERELIRFRREWVGRTLAAEMMGMSVLNPSSAIRITGVV
jgi:hypothetical protein